MSRACPHCGRQETDDAFYCSHCRGRIDVPSVFDGTTPKLFDEYTPERPYIVWTFPFAILATVTMTRDEFLTRTFMLFTGLVIAFLIGVATIGWVVPAFFISLMLFVWYLSWRYGRRNAARPCL